VLLVNTARRPLSQMGFDHGGRTHRAGAGHQRGRADDRNDPAPGSVAAFPNRARATRPWRSPLKDPARVDLKLRRNGTSGGAWAWRTVR